MKGVPGREPARLRKRQSGSGTKHAWTRMGTMRYIHTSGRDAYRLGKRLGCWDTDGKDQGSIAKATTGWKKHYFALTCMGNHPYVLFQICFYPRFLSGQHCTPLTSSLKSNGRYQVDDMSRIEQAKVRAMLYFGQTISSQYRTSKSVPFYIKRVFEPRFHSVHERNSKIPLEPLEGIKGNVYIYATRIGSCSISATSLDRATTAAPCLSRSAFSRAKRLSFVSDAS